MLESKNCFKYNYMQNSICARLPSKINPSCCDKGCLKGRVVCLLLFAISLVFVAAIILELSYRIYQLIKSCIKGIAHDKDQAMVNVADSCWALLISPLATIVVTIKALAGVFLHPGIAFKYNSQSQ